MKEVLMFNNLYHDYNEAVCPICGGKLHICFFHQYEHVYKLLKNGKMSKHHKNVYCGSTEESYIRCENNDFMTDCELYVIEPPSFGGSIIE